MHFAGQFNINAPREKVWGYISDPHTTLDYVPFSKDLKVLSEDKFNISMDVAVGAVRGVFNFNVNIKEIVPPSHASIKAHGEGIRSVADVEIGVDLVENAENKTDLVWRADAIVGGNVAGVGQRLLQIDAEKMIDELFEKLRERLEA